MRARGPGSAGLSSSCQRDHDWVTAARPRPTLRATSVRPCPRPPHDRQTNWARTWLVCCCQEAWHWHWHWHCALLSPSVVPLLIACIESGVLSEWGQRHCPVRLRLRRMLARAWAAAAQHWQCTCWLLHNLAATAIICAIQEPLCGAWRRLTQVSQGHLSAAVHEPLCCALIRALHARATPLWAADRIRSSSQQPHARPPGTGTWRTEQAPGSGEVWLIKPAID